jgi:hypothetical protein
MAAETLSFDDFLSEVRDVVPYDSTSERPLYGVVLGAGASRSAGIPVAPEMVRALRRLARNRGISIRRQRGESDLSSAFRQIFNVERSPTGADDFPSSPRQFLVACIRRANREPNIAHIIAAHLATRGLFNPIVTTNFDDLTLAAFWELPFTSTEDEPHVIYDPAGATQSNPRIGNAVPVVLKAHGHHTSYALGYLDRQIADAAPHVHQLLRESVRPLHGWIVIGYSGDWDDGVMRAFSDKELIGGRTIYWMHRRHAPDNPFIHQVRANARVAFVRIEDADTAMLLLWRALLEDPTPAFAEGRVLTMTSLFSQRRAFWRFFPEPETAGKAWFDSTVVVENDGPPRLSSRLDALRQELEPLLDRIEAIDDKWLVDSVLERSSDARDAGLDKSDRLEHQLQASIPAKVVWTRRNRKLLRIGLAAGTSPYLAGAILGALTNFPLANVRLR